MIRVVLDLPTPAAVGRVAGLLEAEGAKCARFGDGELAEVWQGNAASIRNGLQVLDQLYERRP